MINKNSMASIGVLSNPDNKNIKLGNLFIGPREPGFAVKLEMGI